MRLEGGCYGLILRQSNVYTLEADWHLQPPHPSPNTNPNLNPGQKAYNDKMDALMELDRVTDIKRREAEEARKLAQRIKDRGVIISQIKAREHKKIIEEEAREQEGQVGLG